jgi:hypothetical protein
MACRCMRTPLESGNTSLVRMEAGAHDPSHHHAAIEELFMLSGDLRVESQIIGAGDYCRGLIPARSMGKPSLTADVHS